MDVPPARHPPPLHAHLLGPVHLAVGDRTIPDHAWPRRSARALLLLLLATPGHRLPRDRVLDLLWPEASPEAALNALRVALHALRRVLEPDLRSGRASAYVESGSDAIALHSGNGLWVDVDTFEAALTRARAAAPPERFALLRGPFSSMVAISSPTSRTRIGRSPGGSGCGAPGVAPCWTSPIWTSRPAIRSSRFPPLRRCWPRIRPMRRPTGR